MLQAIQSGTDTFNNSYSLTASKAVTFPTPLGTLDNVQIVATLQRRFKNSTVRNIAVISYDPTTLTTTGVTFTVILNNGYVGKMDFDYVVTGGGLPPHDEGFLLNDTGGYILNDTGGKLIMKTAV